MRQLLQDSGVFAAGTVQQILQGKDFDRGLYALKLLDEVLYCQFLHQFNVWCEKNNLAVSTKVLDQIFEVQHKCFGEDQQAQISATIEETCTVLEQCLLPLINKFREEGREASANFKFWDTFLHRVSAPIKVFLSATRDGNWAAYQSAKMEFIPLLFAAN